MQSQQSQSLGGWRPCAQSLGGMLRGQSDPTVFPFYRRITGVWEWGVGRETGFEREAADQHRNQMSFWPLQSHLWADTSPSLAQGYWPLSAQPGPYMTTSTKSPQLSTRRVSGPCTDGDSLIKFSKPPEVRIVTLF